MTSEPNFLGYRPRFLLALIVSVSLITGLLLASQASLFSVELGVAEQSPMGLAGGEVVPASCPSYAHFVGECDPNPTCTSAGPDGLYVSPSNTSYTLSIYGVSYASSVYFPTWTDVGGQDDIVWHAATDMGGGTWQAVISPASHSGTGAVSSHAYMNGTNGSVNTFCDTANFVKATPTCTSAGPDGTIVDNSATSHTISAYGVANANTVRFATWTDVNGQDDIVWYPATNMGGGTWEATVNPSSHSGTGAVSVHAYMDVYGGSTMCDTANFTKSSDSCANIVGVQAGVPAGYYQSGSNCYETTSFSVTPGTIDAGDSATLTWSCGASSSASSPNFATGGAPSGSVEVSPTVTTTYDLACQSGGSGQTTLTITNPSLSISANPSRVRPGSAAALTWNATDVNSCVLNGPGSVTIATCSSTEACAAAHETSSGAISAQSTYTLTCQTATGSGSASVIVGITPTQVEI